MQPTQPAFVSDPHGPGAPGPRPPIEDPTPDLPNPAPIAPEPGAPPEPIG